MQHMARCPNRLIEGRAVASRLCGEHLPHHSEAVPPTKTRRNQGPHAIVEKNCADTIAPGGRQSKEAGDLGDEVMDRHDLRPELGRGRQVHENEDVEIALFTVSLHVQGAGPRSDIPIDGSNVVTSPVLSDLLELKSEPTERTLVLAGQPGIHCLTGADLEPSDLGSELCAGLS
jgi:hypothetical protein